MQLLGDISTCGATAGVFAQPRPIPDISNWSEVSWRSSPRLHRDQPSGSSLGAQPSAFSLVANAFQSCLRARGGREDFEDSRYGRSLRALSREQCALPLDTPAIT